MRRQAPHEIHLVDDRAHLEPMRRSIVLTIIMLAACATEVAPPAVVTPTDPEPAPTGKTATAAAVGTTTRPISYHGRALLTGDVPIFIIYYGGWLDTNGQWTAYASTAWLVEHFIDERIGDRGYLLQENWAPASPGYWTQGA